MSTVRRLVGAAIAALGLSAPLAAQIDPMTSPPGTALGEAFRRPDLDARPWVYWYWLNAAVSEPAIDADLRAMKAAGLAGAYLMPISGPLNPPLVSPPVTQLSPLWWQMVRHAFAEADRLGLKLALQDCDGFATAGGPWITPEHSMQHVVWSATQVDATAASQSSVLALPQPPAQEGYYRDIAVLAFPAQAGSGSTSWDTPPEVTAGPIGRPATSHPEYLGKPPVAPLATYGQVPKGMLSFTGQRPSWIAFRFDQPFTCRALTIRTGNSGTYGANRPRLEASDDGVNFRFVAELESPRHGWMDWDEGVTHAVPATTARWFRLVYDRPPGEAGTEDLDSAKWDNFKVLGVRFFANEKIDNFEGKSGDLWRIAPIQPVEHPIALRDIVDVTSRLDAAGRLRWTPRPGRWTVLRIGHTSTGHVNETGGGGKGLECDKFDPTVARFQFDHWFGEAIRQIGPALAGRALPVFHVDSWECGSQNWSPVFAAEFSRRRGYDLTRYLPAMAGYPVESAEISERFLRDVRSTIGELVVDNFFRPMAALAHEHGCAFSAESVAPVLVGDGMAHYDAVDLPMGEFWLRSPTHDKLNDVLDAVSGARIYGKSIAQSEAFTELKLGWDEAPGMLKPLADRNYAFGMNRYVYHVFMHNPWLDRHPGVTLNGVGTFFQRDQTWWDLAGKTWTDYAARCQGVLQLGSAVVDVAVFTGEEVPRRAVLPWDLAGIFPGLIGDRARLKLPTSGAAIREPADWVDPLQGYAYDSINRDALLRLATVQEGRIVLPGGASYAALVIPGSRPLDPDASGMTPEVARKLMELARAGAKIVLGEKPTHSSSLTGGVAADQAVRRTGDELWHAPQVHQGPWIERNFEAWGIDRDFIATDANGVELAPGTLAWTHRRLGSTDVYFVANQTPAAHSVRLSLRASGAAQVWDPVTGEQRIAEEWAAKPGSEAKARTRVSLALSPQGSRFVVVEPVEEGLRVACTTALQSTIALDADWLVQFDPARGGPAAPVPFPLLQSWTERPEAALRHYSGTAVYRREFRWHYGRGENGERVWLDLGNVGALAKVTVNGRDCGVAWTPPYQVEITGALKEGGNQAEIAVVNTWRNRLVGDSGKPVQQRSTWTNAKDLPAEVAMLAAGLLGPVSLKVQIETSGMVPASELAPAPTPEMQRIYDEVKTPFKRGIVLQPGTDELFDCPSVFRFGSAWYMIFVSNQHKIGYQTRLARSADLLHWTILGTILPFSGHGWDAAQADGGAALVDPKWNGSAQLEKHNGHYWMSYIGGALPGYEPDPLSIGLAYTDHPDRPEAWRRLESNPILGPSQPETRPWEQATLYKSSIVRDPARTLGAPFIMFYNGKQKGPWVERIGSAVSDDLVHWRRTIAEPAVDNGRGISGDPQLVRMGDLWVMFYFGAGWGKGARAFDTFAVSRDLVHWQKWTGPNLISPTETWDATYAHKPWLLKHDGVVYHFYCAVAGDNRAIAVATSRDMGP